MKKLTLFLILFYGMSTCLHAQTRIAVYISGVLSENYNTLLGDNLVETFAESNQYIAVNRSDALNLMLKKAQSIQENGHIDYTQVVSATKQYGESQLCAVNVIEIDYMYVFRASLLDVQTNTVIKTASAEAPKSEIGYTKILEIAQKLSNRLLPNAQQSNNSNLSSIKAASDIELARKKVEENRKYDISYATFQNNLTKYRKECPPTDFYLKKNESLSNAAIMLFCIPVPAVGFGAALGIGLGAQNLSVGQKIGAITGIVVATMLPSIICWSVAPAYKKKAWRAYREPYDNAVKDLNEARKYSRTSLELAPAVGYDWAGLSLKFKLN